MDPCPSAVLFWKKPSIHTIRAQGHPETRPGNGRHDHQRCRGTIVPLGIHTIDQQVHPSRGHRKGKETTRLLNEKAQPLFDQTIVQSNDMLDRTPGQKVGPKSQRSY